MDRPLRQSQPIEVYEFGLDKSEGVYLCTAGEVLLKSVFESELAVSLVVTPNDPAFAGLLESGRQTMTQQLLVEHDCRLELTDTAARAVQLGQRAARSGQCALALVPNDHLDRAMPELTAARSRGLVRGGALCVILEDRPSAMPASCPRRAAARLGIATLEPVDLRQLREMIAAALRMSRGAELPAAIVVHESILHTMMTLEMRPNRVGETVTILHADRRRQRKLRFSESKDVLRLAQRLELNAARALPNPGEQVPIGFVTVGPADEALRHLTHVLKLHGRIPTMSLGLLYPLDETALGRLLTRCDRVIVLEPRPGSMEIMLLQTAERLRQGGAKVATIWGRTIPGDVEGQSLVLESEDDLHPSVLVRKIQHLLHEIRPTLSMVQKLAPPPPVVQVEMGDGASLSDTRAAELYLAGQLEDLERWLGEQAGSADGTGVRTGLALDGELPAEECDRLVTTELWTRETFLDAGIGAMAHAAFSMQPWLMLICDLGARDDQDVERLVKSAIPARHTDRARVRTVDIKGTIELRELLRSAVASDGLTVVIVRDAAPSRFDAHARARELREVDQLGYEPVQRVRWSAEQACTIRPSPLRVPAGEAVSAENAAVQTDVRVDALPERLSAQFRARLRLLDEIIEVTRHRAPVPFWRGAATVALPAGRPVHADQSYWRAHCAGIRGTAPGIAVRILCEAGRLMGYEVHCRTDSSSTGPGSTLWSQVLFCGRDPNAVESSVATSIPYGEADVLLGLTSRETLRALRGDSRLRVGSASRTYLIANTGAVSGESRGTDTALVEQALRSMLGQCVRPDDAFVQNVAAACRAGFYSDRITDLVLLGVAFQRGLIPVTYSAMITALQTADNSGVGRVMETFDFGRRLAEEPMLLSRPRTERVESVDEMRRRMRLSLAKRRWRGKQRATRFDAMLDTCLRGMPGLTETDAGRQARRDLVAALYRCLLWGGPAYAERYADLIVQLYHVDRGDTGRALTRFAVLPLAQAMLIHDPLFVATMTMSAEHRRRIRQQLNVKPARGDQVQRRYLLRIELSVQHKRYRADVRASDWIARAMSAVRVFVPSRLRGSQRDRAVRDAVAAVVNQARFDPPQQYERNLQMLVLLHGLAEADKLRSIPAIELKSLLDRDGGSLREVDEPSTDGTLEPVESADNANDGAAEPEETASSNVSLQGGSSGGPSG